MFCRKLIDVYCERYTKHMSTIYEYSVMFPTVKPGGTHSDH